MSNAIKNLLLWLLIITILVVVFNNTGNNEAGVRTVTYTSFIKEVDNGKVARAEIANDKIRAVTTDQNKITTVIPLPDQGLLPKLVAKGVEVKGVPAEQPNFWLHALVNALPVLLLLGLWFYMMRQMGSGGKSGPLSFGKSRARLSDGDKIKVTFADVAGVDEAKEEVQELVDFLRDPRKFQKLGGKIPCGVLLVGSPGTGKTLLAKAVAGEAKVPFFSISGSDFVEMFVGVGASRVRDLFETAKKHAPCIIFIDEIDAVGRHRGAGLGGGHDEREQTLNQLLVEMDGFVGKEGVIVIAATNRPDVLDPALLRPGRFDRRVTVPLPDVRGREQILRTHIKKIPASSDVDPKIFARSTPGFSGADLASLVNEAALFAARANKEQVEISDFERAKDKLIMGAERRSLVMSEAEKQVTAYHEAGHVIVGYLLTDKGHDPIYKATIIPRNEALGVTMFLPEKDHYNYSKQTLEVKMACLFGGRLAELIKFGADEITIGASNDIERATDLARKMVTRWGLSSLGPMTYDDDEGEIFLGRSITSHKEMSDATALKIDEEIRTIVERNYQIAEKLLRVNLDKLDAMAAALIKYETIDCKQIKAIMDGKRVRQRKHSPEKFSTVKMRLKKGVTTK